MKRTTQLLNATLTTIAALSLATASAPAAPNNVKFRNCTSKILILRSFNS
jgi:hypothetical protein